MCVCVCNIYCYGKVSPIRNKSSKGLPPHLIITASLCPYKDHSYVYSKRLREEGVRCDVVTIHNAVHGFVR